MINIDALNDDEKLAALESIHKSIAQSKEIQKKKITTNVEMIVKALKKIETDLQQRYDQTGKLIANLKNGEDGRDGRDGKDGKDGKNGRDGAIGQRGFDGTPGRDGAMGQDGVSVIDAQIDFDGSLTITLSNGNVINAGEIVNLDLAEKIKVITNGGGTSQFVIDTLASLQAQISAISSGLEYQGTWNASTNTPTLASSVGTAGYYYIVGTAGSTNLNGVTDWQVGDWAVFNGSVWQKIDQTNLVTSVAGRTGAIVLTTADIGGLGTIATQAANNVSITGGSITGITDLAIADGGTGQSTAAAAITALTGTQTSGRYLRSDGTNAALAAIVAGDVPTLNQNTTGTAANVTGTVAIANGGTGQTTATAAFNALAPSQTGNSGKYLTTNGTDTSWATNPLGTVTSVGGTGTVNGLTLTGTVTTSGNLTLGGTLSSIANSALTNSSITIGGTAIALGASSNTLSNDITINSLTVGRGASSISSNSAFGSSALTANTTGYNNTGIGKGALSNNLGAYNNTAVGFESGFSHNTGNNNTSVGSQALFGNQTGSENVALGAGALYGNDSGQNNIAIGYEALKQSTIVGNNTSIGHQSLYSSGQAVAAGSLVVGVIYKIWLVGTTNWVSIGAASNTAGVVFTATGVGSGFGTAVINGGANNTALGYLSGYSVTGSSNTLIGYSAGLSISTGSNNTTLGFDSGKGITTGSKNVVIGSYAGIIAPISMTGNNYIVFSDGDANVRGYFNSSGVLNIANLTASKPVFTDASKNLVSTGTLGSDQGGTGLTSFTANGVVYASSSSALATGSALTFDGTSLTIGTSSAFPLTGSKLSIGNDANSALRLSIANQNAGASALVGIDFQPAGGAWKIDVPSDTSGFLPPMYFKAGASTNVTFAYGGNVGIGTTAPAAKLDVTQSSASNVVTALMLRNPNSTFAGTGTKIYFSCVAANDRGSYIESASGAANDTYLAFATNSAGANATERLRLDASGNLGLGVTPSAFASGQKALQIGSTVVLYQPAARYTALGSNFYDDGTNGRYLTTGTATIYQQNRDTGVHAWYNAPSGTAGNAITFTQAMTLDASGNLGIGTTSPTTKLNLSNSASDTFIRMNANTHDAYIGQTTAGEMRLVTAATGSFMTFLTDSAERARIDSSGRLGVGTTSPSQPVEVQKNFDGATWLKVTNTTNGTGARAGLLLANDVSDYGSIELNSSSVAGTANALSIRTSAAYPIAFSTNNAERARIDSSGNFGIGTTSITTGRAAIWGNGNGVANNTTNANSQLHLVTTDSTVSANNSARITFNAGNSNTANAKIEAIRDGLDTFQVVNVLSGPLVFGTNNTERARIDSSGNFMIGATSPRSSARVTVDGTNDATSQISLYRSDSATRAVYGANYLGTFSNSAFEFYTNSSLRATIDTSGNLLVGNTSATGTPTVGFCLLKDFTAANASGISIGHITGTGGGAVYAQFAYAGASIGNITQSGTTAVLYNVTSDQRLKENIVDAPEFGSVIDSIQVRSYDWKSDGSHQRAGFVAQELVTVAPEAVHQPADSEEMMAVDYSKLVPMLVKEIQSLRKRLADAGI